MLLYLWLFVGMNMNSIQAGNPADTNTLTFTTTTIFSGDEIFSEPANVVHGAGMYVILDVQEGCLFVYNEDGTFKKRVGNKGQGPGEFELQHKVAKVAFDPIDQMFIVVDTIVKKLHYFDRTLTFRKTKTITGIDILEFVPLKNGNIVVSGRKDGSYATELWDRNLNLVKELDSFENKKWQKKNEKYVFHAWAGMPHVFAETNYPYIFYGNKADDRIQVFDTNGKLVSTILCPWGRQEVTESDKRSLIEANIWLKNYPVIWPKHRYAWDAIKPLSSDLVFLGKYHRETGTFEGLVSRIEEVREGAFKPMSRFKRSFGYSAGFTYVNGTLCIIESDSDGDYLFKIQEVSYDSSQGSQDAQSAQGSKRSQDARHTPDEKH